MVRAKSSSASALRTTAATARPEILTRLAFALSIALVIARLLMLETLRSTVDALPGVAPTPAGPGPATGLVLDLLFLLPSLLVLARRTLDPNYLLRASWGAVLFMALGLWAVLSTIWAADRFAGAVSSVHWFSAMIFIWSSAQLLRSWLQARVVAGTCLGLLMVLAAVGYEFRFVEWRDLKSEWEQKRAEILREHHWSADSFDARQFEKRILSGAILGYTASPNSYAAIVVLLSFTVIGLTLDRRMNGDPWGWLVVPVLALLAAVPVLRWAASRGAAGSALLGLILLIAVFLFRRRLQERARAAYWTGVGLLTFVIASIVMHGLRRGTLFHDSLTFRWRYWVGAARLIARHPLLGVGWENFGPAYLKFRLPIASEEIRDPHNFIVRVISESGMIGGSLLILALARTAWELTQYPAAAREISPESGRTEEQEAMRGAVILAAIAIVAMAINLAASIDLSAGFAYVLYEGIRRAFFLTLLAMGMAMASFRSPPDPAGKRDGEIAFVIDRRPTDGILPAILVGLFCFLVHNLIDFAMFEYGAMFLFAFLVGSALGLKIDSPTQGVSPTDARGRHSKQAAQRRPLAAIGALVAGCAVWISLLILVVVPVATAEGLARDSDYAIRAGRLDVAEADLASAFERVSYNGDYALHAAIIAAQAGKTGDMRKFLDDAIAANPSLADALLMRAEWAMALNPPDAAVARTDFERAIALNPNNVGLHLRYADALTRLRDNAGAAAALSAALQSNNGLDRDDPKRLPPDQVAAILDRIERLRPVGK